MAKRTNTTKDIGLLRQLYKDNQLELVAEFQRNSVWPPAAKAYLLDSVMNDRPIPILFFQRSTSAQTGRPSYAVIDGQQRLRAIFEFLDDRFRLTQSAPTARYYKKKFSALTGAEKEQVLAYDLPIAELSGYSNDDIIDMFVRMNKYVVKLSPQELRHAREQGRFRDFVEEIGRLAFWGTERVFTPKQIARFKAVEYAAELVILLVEGPQDKKKAVDLYYGKFRDALPFKSEVNTRLRAYLEWIREALPKLSTSRFRKPVDLYSLIGALDQLTDDGSRLSRFPAKTATSALEAFERATQSKQTRGDVSKYLLAASRQTDNLRPRTTRIDVIRSVLDEAY